MAITNFIPALWEGMLLEQWLADNVFANLVNRDYEGLATKGNTVHIQGVVTPTIKDYKAAGRTTSAGRGRPPRRSTCSSTRRRTSTSPSTTSTGRRPRVRWSRS
jgi:hypothetical protein